jgi:acetyl esterase/lipase
MVRKLVPKDTRLNWLTFSARVHHGDLDNVIPLQASQQMVQALGEAGAEVKFTRYPSLLHDSWSAAYSNLEVYQWMFGCKRAFRDDGIVVPEASKRVVIDL